MKNHRKATLKKALLFLVAGMMMLTGCEDPFDPVYRDHMRDFVTGIAEYARDTDPGFIIIPQNGIELVTENGEPGGTPAATYLAAIDGIGQEDLFFGYRQDNKATPESETVYLLEFLSICRQQQKKVLVTDYCSSTSLVDESFARSAENGFISFAAPDRELTIIPGYPDPVNGFNNKDILRLSDASNFLYLINPEQFEDRASFIEALSLSSYDLFIMDLFFDGAPLTFQEVESLKTKPQGGARLVIAYMSIGEAEDYRYYWDPDWAGDPPDWLLEENPDWEGNYKVEFWSSDWQSKIFGSPDAYLDRLLSAGFNGAYLDIIEAFEYFE